MRASPRSAGLAPFFDYLGKISLSLAVLNLLRCQCSMADTSCIIFSRV